MTLDLTFPWSNNNLGELKTRIEAVREKNFELRWYWEPFHRPGFEALVYAQRHQIAREDFEKRVKNLSSPRPPSWLSSKVKTAMKKAGVVGEEGEIIPLDPQKTIEKTFKEASFQLEPFANAHLFSVTELKCFMEQNFPAWVPEFSTMKEVTELSNWLTPYPELLKSFHDLGGWDRLEFLESTMGLLNSLTILNFTRIY